MNAPVTLAHLTAGSGLEVLDHLALDIVVPVISGLQAQGDLIVVPHAMLAGAVTTTLWTRTVPVPRSGVELLRSAGGGNPHSLVADDGTCTWSSPVRDTRGLALGILDCGVTAYLIHPEHGASGIAPGRYVIGRQRERGSGRLRGPQLVAD